MYPLPDQPPPDGWVYIEHADVGRSANPVHRDSLPAWVQSGWSEATTNQSATGSAQAQATSSTATAPAAEKASPAPAKE